MCPGKEIKLEYMIIARVITAYGATTWSMLILVYVTMLSVCSSTKIIC